MRRLPAGKSALGLPCFDISFQVLSLRVDVSDLAQSIHVDSSSRTDPGPSDYTCPSLPSRLTPLSIQEH